MQWCPPRHWQIVTAAAAVVTAIVACNSHPMVSRTPDTVVSWKQDGGLPDAEPDVVPGPDVVSGLLPDLAQDLAWTADRAGPRELELLSWIHSVGGTPVRVLKSGHTVYLGDWENPQAQGPGGHMDGGVQAYDVAAPRSPTRISTLYTPAHQIQDLAMDEPWLYAANDLLGFRLVDIAQPNSLRSASSWVNPSPIDSRAYATAVTTAGRLEGGQRRLYAFVGYLYGNGLDIHVVPDGGPIAPPILHYGSSALPSRCDVHQVRVRGDRAYLLASDGGTSSYLEILDLSPLPAAPTLLGRLALPMASFGGIGDLVLSGDLLFLSASDYKISTASHAGGLRIIDVHDPVRPTLVGSLDLAAGAIPWKGTGLAVSGGEVFFITSTGVQRIDVTTPASPSPGRLTSFPSDFGVCQGGTAVVDGDLLYVGAYCAPPGGIGGLAIYRMPSP